jgi:hypothetical protein
VDFWLSYPLILNIFFVLGNFVGSLVLFGLIGILKFLILGFCFTDEVNRFSTKYLTEAVKKAKKEKKRGLEQLIKNKVEFGLKFGSVKQAFCKLIFRKTESQVKHLKSQLGTIQKQLSHQERIFARIEIRRQGRELLTCEYKNRLGCPGVYQCDNCQVNYSITADNQQAAEIIK